MTNFFKSKKTKTFTLTTLTFLLISCSKDYEIGSKDEPLKLYFVPSDNTQKIEKNAVSVKAFMEKFVSQKLYNKDEGFYIKTAVPLSHVAVVEALGTKRADFAALGTFDYVLAKDIKKLPVEAVLNIVRGENELTYKSAIIAHVDSKINTLEDLKGKKFAYVDASSASGYILPNLLFKDKKIDLGQTVFAQRHDNVVTMVYQKQVDGGSIYYNLPKGKEMKDARARVLTQFPDVEKKVKIIGFTQEIPNAPWVLRSNLYKDPAKFTKVKEALQEGIIAFMKTEEGKAAMMDLYSITGFVKTNDEDFKDVRKSFLQAYSQLEAEKKTTTK
jgi:phosphonate transport system substrate-binding protein